MLNSLLKASYDEYHSAVNSSVRRVDTPESVFDVFLKKCIQHHGQPVHSFQEMRTIKSTKAKGDLFELFCQRYLLTIKDYDQVWLLRELTQDLKRELRLPLGNKDYGIDLIAVKYVEGQPVYSAIQCKFKTPRPPLQIRNSQGKPVVIYPSVGWKEICTFNELCNASGPFKERITMTTAKSVRRMGGIKNDLDRSICLQGLQGLSTEQWQKLMKVPVPYEPAVSEITPIDESSSSTGKIKLKMKPSSESPPTEIVPPPVVVEPSLSVVEPPKSKKTIPRKVKQPPRTQLNIEDIRNKRLEYLQKSGILTKPQLNTIAKQS